MRELLHMAKGRREAQWLYASAQLAAFANANRAKKTEEFTLRDVVRRLYGFDPFGKPGAAAAHREPLTVPGERMVEVLGKALAAGAQRERG